MKAIRRTGAVAAAIMTLIAVAVTGAGPAAAAGDRAAGWRCGLTTYQTWDPYLSLVHYVYNNCSTGTEYRRLYTTGGPTYPCHQIDAGLIKELGAFNPYYSQLPNGVTAC